MVLVLVPPIMHFFILAITATYFLETDTADLYISHNNRFSFLFNRNDVQDFYKQKTLNPPIEKTQLQLLPKNEMLQLCNINSRVKVQLPQNYIAPFLSNIIIDKNGYLYIEKRDEIYSLKVNVFELLKRPRVINGIVFCVNKHVNLYFAPNNTIIFIIKLVLHITNGSQSRKLYYNYIYSPYEGTAKVKIIGSVLTINNCNLDIEGINGNITNIYTIKSVGENNLLQNIYKSTETVIAEEKRRGSLSSIILGMLCFTFIIFLYQKEKNVLVICKEEISSKKGYSLYNGTFSRSPALIKVFKKNDNRYHNEIAIMKILQTQHVNKYYYMEAHEKNVKLVFEPSKELDRKLSKLELLKIVELLCQMQNINVVYNNLSLENIRLNIHSQIILVNFEDALQLGTEMIFADNRNLGTENWRCTDIILHNKDICAIKQDALLNADVFSLGILLYYNEKKKNPFDINSDSIEQNIVTNQYILEYIPDHSLHDLICHCIKIKHNERISIQEVLNHPYFWSAEKSFNFLANLSDYIEHKKETSKRVFLRLERNKHKIYQELWSKNLDAVIVEELKTYRDYNEKLVKGLLRAIRNKGRHYKELPAAIKAIYRSFPDGYMQYYISRFPSLIMVCHYSAKCIAEDDLMKGFYVV